MLHVYLNKCNNFTSLMCFGSQRDARMFSALSSKHICLFHARVYTLFEIQSMNDYVFYSFFVLISSNRVNNFFLLLIAN